jgi:hypothetical protein
MSPGPQIRPSGFFIESTAVLSLSLGVFMQSHASSATPPPGCPAHVSNVKVVPDGVSMTRLSPFGLLIEAGAETSLDAFAPAQIHALVGRFKVVAFRGFQRKWGDAFPQWCLRLGELLDWEFGTVNTLKIDPEKKN